MTSELLTSELQCLSLKNRPKPPSRGLESSLTPGTQMLHCSPDVREAYQGASGPLDALEKSDLELKSPDSSSTCWAEPKSLGQGA